MRKFRLLILLVGAIPFSAWSDHSVPLPPISDACLRHLVNPGVHEGVWTLSTPSVISARQDGRWVQLEPRQVSINPVAKVSILVPIYKEFENKNIHRLIQMLQRQTLHPSLFQVIGVINNTSEVAGRKDHPTLLENKKTIAWLEDVRRTLPFHFEVVDETKGFERNMGLLRNRALFRALEITNVPLRQHIFVNLDADSTFDPQYLERIVSYYDRYDLDSVILRRTHTIPDDVQASFFQSHHYSLQGHLYFDFFNVWFYPHHGYSTPQITFRADVAKSLSGFVPLAENEDLDMGLRLAKFKTAIVPDIVVAVSDRARDDGFDAARRLIILEDEAPKELVTHGIGFLIHKYMSIRSLELEAKINANRLAWYEAFGLLLADVRKAVLSNELENQPHNPDYKKVISLIQELNSLPQAKERVPTLIHLLNLRLIFNEIDQQHTFASYFFKALQNFLSPSELRNFNDLWDRRMAHHSQLVNERLSDLRTLLRGNELTITPANMSDPFRRHLRLHISRGLGDEIRSVAYNYRIRGRFASTHRSEDEMLHFLQSRYPDWLQSDSAFAMEIETLRFLLDWLMHARMNPEEFPGTTRAAR